MKLRRKLLAAGLALGATALTLTTSTFAWYTANTEVKMDGVKGQSAVAAGSTLLISSVSTQGTFGSSVTLGTTVTTLQPVQYASNASGAPTFTTLQKSDSNSASGAAAAGNVLAFNLYFKASTATNVYINKLEVKHADDWALNPKDILTTAGTPYSSAEAETKGQYTVDILRTLKMAWYTESVKAGTPSATTTTSGTKVRDLSNLVTPSTADSISVDGGTWNAHDYYEAVSGETLSATGRGLAVSDTFTLDNAGDASIIVGQTPAGTEKGTYLHMYVYFFIDGWDAECFDAVQNQTFTVNMEFSSEANTSLSKTA